MAKTYLGYVKRDAGDQINWQEVGANINKTLQAEVLRRETLKAEIDKASDEFGEVLANAPQSEHQSLQQFSLGFADNAAQARLVQDRLLKNGSLKMRDYIKMRQNLTDGTDDLFSLVKDYDTYFTEKKKRMNGIEVDGKMIKSAYQEQWDMANAEQFTNLSGTEAWIDPMTYTVSVGKKVNQNGVVSLSKDPNDFTSLQSLRLRLRQEVNQYNVEDGLKVGVDKLAETYLLAEYKGDRKGSDDVRQMPEYLKARDNFIASQMVNPQDVGSVLTDYISVTPEGNTYSFTYDPKMKGKVVNGEELILLIDDPNNPGSGRKMPDLTDKQFKAAKDALTTRFESMVDRKDEIRVEPKDRVDDDDKDKLRGAKDDGKIVSNIAALYYGDENEGRTALSFLSGLDRNKDFFKMDRDKDNVILYARDGDGNITTTSLPFRDSKGDVMSQKDFIISASSRLGGVTDVEAALKQSQYDPNKTFNEEATYFTETTTEQADPNAGNTFSTAEIPEGDSFVTVVDFVNRKTDDASVDDGSIKWTSMFPDGVKKRQNMMIGNAQKAFSTLPGQRGVSIQPTNSVSATDGGVMISIDGITSAPLVVPATINNQGIYTAVMQYVYDKAAKGETVRPNDIKQFFTDSAKYESYNSEKVAKDNGYGDNWNGGDGNPNMQINSMAGGAGQVGSDINTSQYNTD